MTDIYTKEKRSKLMASIATKNTSPELIIRKALFKLGFRYRVNLKTLPGSPDIVLPKYRTVIFIHGCFWHQHGCSLSTLPKSNVEFWKEKLGKNVERDERQKLELESMGWKVLTVWQCQTKKKVLEKTIDELVAAIKS